MQRITSEKLFILTPVEFVILKAVKNLAHSLDEL